MKKHTSPGQRRRRKPSTPLRRVSFLILLALVASGGVYLSTFAPSSSSNTGTPLTDRQDQFIGAIINRPFTGMVEGSVEADLDCTGSMSAVTCRAIIRPENTGKLEFQYTHNMTTQACLSPGDRVVVDGSAPAKVTVTRLRA